MNDIFAKWYASHDTSGNEDRLKNRLEILEEVEGDEDAPHIYDFFNFYLKKNGEDQSVSNYLSGKVKEYEGEEFVVHKNELEVLACGVILYYSHDAIYKNKLKTNLVLRVLALTGSASSRLAEMAEDSISILSDMSVSSRNVRYGSSILKKEIDSFSQTFKQAGNNIAGQGDPILKAILALQTAVNNLSGDIGVVREENQLLWWLKTMSLKSLDIDLSELAPANRIICAAYDLNVLSTYYAFPAASSQFILDAYLASEGKLPKKVSLKSIIEGMSIEHVAKILEGFEKETEEYRHFYPMLEALRIALEHSKSKNQDKTKLPNSAKMLKLDLAVEQAIELALCEIALLRVENK